MRTNHFDEAAATWDDEPRRIQLTGAVGAAIVRRVRPAPAMRVLDYGCGTGLLGLYLLDYVDHVTGADNSPGMLNVLREKIRTGNLAGMNAVALDLERDAAPVGQYDLVVSSLALHHIADVDRVLRGFHTMLRAGGRVALADLDTEPGTFHPAAVAPSVHHHGFDRAALKRQLATAGLVEAHDETVTTFEKPIEAGGAATFSVFLVTARRP